MKNILISKHIKSNFFFRILQHFNVDSNEYEVIFTSNATASLKLVAESFTFSENFKDFGTFWYNTSNHTSVLGMRSIVNTPNIKPFNKEELFGMIDQKRLAHSKSYSKNSLITFSAQCNFNGFKFPLNVIEKIHMNGLSDDANHYVCLDAASFCSTNFLDMKLYKPDFVCMSFYKMIG
jgi:molybdenum cofactor sulfurtransferase